MCQSKSRAGHKAPSQGKANPSRKEAAQAQPKERQIEETQTEPEPFPDSTIFNIGSQSDTPITVQLKLDEQKVIMEVDTGAAVTLTSEETQKKLFPKANLS